VIHGDISGAAVDAALLGRQLASDLLSSGAREILGALLGEQD
jgi:hypothetical protein